MKHHSGRMLKTHQQCYQAGYDDGWKKCMQFIKEQERKDFEAMMNDMATKMLPTGQQEANG